METLELVFGKATIRITSDDAMTTSEQTERVATATPAQEAPVTTRKAASKGKKSAAPTGKAKKSDKKAQFAEMQRLIAGGDYKAAKAYVAKNAPQWADQCEDACTRHSAKQGAVKPATKKAATKKAAAKAPAGSKAKKTTKKSTKKTTSSNKKSVVKTAEENVAAVSPPPVRELDMADNKPATWLKGLDYPADPTPAGTRSYLKQLREESAASDGELVNVENVLDELENMSDILSAAIDEAQAFGATIAVTKLRQMFAALEATHLDVLQDRVGFGADDTSEMIEEIQLNFLDDSAEMSEL